MAILSDKNIDPYWFEKELIISLLEKEPLSRIELRNRIIRLQQDHPHPLFQGKYHTNSTYNYWIRKLKEQCLVREINKIFILTNLGKWVANSNLNDICDRYSFLETFICKECSKKVVTRMIILYYVPR